ncbi:MAG: hypothetical protein M3P18_11880 [Actinomycetota bacterium]|nr:hypothetical protein [Actinomycetota bacterium]
MRFALLPHMVDEMRHLLAVPARLGRKQTASRGMPFCNWPGGAAISVYWAAVGNPD